MGFTFAFTESYVANSRQKSDPINSATGACAAGFLVGLRSMFIPLSVSSRLIQMIALQHALYQRLSGAAFFLEQRWVHSTMLVSYREGMGPH